LGWLLVKWVLEINTRIGLKMKMLFDKPGKGGRS
jgi:hypothetical protein